MLKVDQYEYVRTARRVYGKSVSEIARETGHSRNTVKKVLRGEHRNYAARERQAYPVLGPYLEIIDDWLEKDKLVTDPKQRHTAIRIYARLVREHGFGGSASNVRKYVRGAKKRLGLKTSEVFIPLEPEPGMEAEVDWGNATVMLDGAAVRVKSFCMRSKSSGKPFVRLYPCERQQAFLDGLARGFEFFGGVFPVVVFDNLTTAVEKVLKGKGRVEREAFSRFKAYASFEARFCNPGKGNEKGGVEGLVGFSRRNFLVPLPEGSSLAEINERLLEECVHYGRTHRIHGRERIVEYDPPHRFAISWDEGREGTALFELFEAGDRTRLVLTHNGITGPGPMANFGGGWHAHLAVLAARLAGRRVADFWALHGESEAAVARQLG